MIVSLIGVPFDAMGRHGGQAAAPPALRAAGLEKALGLHDVVARPDLPLPAAREE